MQSSGLAGVIKELRCILIARPVAANAYSLAGSGRQQSESRLCSAKLENSSSNSATPFENFNL
jgi:hypothetical protein